MTDVAEAFVSQSVSHGGFTYNTVQSPDTTEIWLDRNLGASQVCTSSSDALCYGNYYQWGRNDDGHELGPHTSANKSTVLADSITPTTISTFISDGSGPHDWTTADSAGSDRTIAWGSGGVNNICPSGFRVPTEKELTDDTISATTTDVTNSATAFSSFLVLPGAGIRHRDDGRSALVGSGYVWSSSAVSNNARNLFFDSSEATFSYSHSRASGFSVRCIKD